MLNAPWKVLVIGYGSIGARHARILTELGCDVAVVSRREIDFSNVYSNIAIALTQFEPNYVVVANRTIEHAQTLAELAILRFGGVVLVEKPLFDSTQSLPDNIFSKVLIAYNLRFHPVIMRLKKLLEGETVLSVQAYTGQYLPEWRPQSDYRQGYSACAAQGGGVLRDLSHELDYLSALFGRWQRITAIGGHFSELEIDSDDIFTLLYSSEECPAISLQMNYLDRMGRRILIINTQRHTIHADLVNATITIDRDIEHFAVGRDDTYRSMHSSILHCTGQDMCSVAEGLEIMDMINAAELAAVKQEWVER